MEKKNIYRNEFILKKSVSGDLMVFVITCVKDGKARGKQIIINSKGRVITATYIDDIDKINMEKNKIVIE